MKIQVKDELLLIAIVTLLTVAAVSLMPPNPVRVISGFLLMLFFPGYTFIAALFPKKNQLSAVERLAFSLGFSIAIVALIGLMLNYSPIGVRLYTVLFPTAVFVLGASAFAYFRRRRLPEAERFYVTWTINFTSWRQQKRFDRILTVVLIGTIAMALGTYIYAIAFPPVGERFTEFYVLGAEDKAADYPTQLAAGQPASVKIGIINREHETASYHIEVTIDGIPASTTDQVTLAHDEKWEQTVTFIPDKAGDHQKVEFILFKDGMPHQPPLHLWVNVR